MTGFEMAVFKKGFAFRFSGEFEEEAEADVHAMIAAMAEGLEANGFTVDATITLHTTHKVP